MLFKDMAKRLAVADEDYDKAKEIKDEVDILRAEIEEKVTVTLGSWNLYSDIYPILLSFVLVIRLLLVTIPESADNQECRFS